MPAGSISGTAGATTFNDTVRPTPPPSQLNAVEVLVMPSDVYVPAEVIVPAMGDRLVYAVGKASKDSGEVGVDAVARCECRIHRCTRTKTGAWGG